MTITKLLTKSQKHSIKCDVEQIISELGQDIPLLELVLRAVSNLDLRTNNPTVKSIKKDLTRVGDRLQEANELLKQSIERIK